MRLADAALRVQRRWQAWFTLKGIVARTGRQFRTIRIATYMAITIRPMFLWKTCDFVISMSGLSSMLEASVLRKFAWWHTPPFPRKEPSMADSPTHHKFPKDWANRDYFVFEKLSDGSAILRGYVRGMENVELKLLELGRESNNKFFAINLGKRFQPIIRPLSRVNSDDDKRAIG